jgi:ribosomal protein L7/L12
VWPALVAVLAGSDEKLAATVLPYFRNLGSVADAVTSELVALFREPNPTYAARAVIALGRLGRLLEVASELRTAVESGPDDGWGWTVLRGAVDRLAQSHALLRELIEVFAVSPADIVARVTALLDAPQSEREVRLTACIAHLDDATGAASVDWNGVYREVGTDADGPLVYLALMCEYGSAGLANHKIWMIKALRALCGCGLADAKNLVERVGTLLSAAGSAVAERREAVRAFFTNRIELPVEIVKLLDHPVSWFRWAALELADAWGLKPEQASELTEDRVCDCSPRVRERALRMVRGEGS